MKVARIRCGAIVFQDRSFPHWGHHIGAECVDQLFKVGDFDANHNSYTVTAFGYGFQGDTYGPGAYGNGALFVKVDDLSIFEVDYDLLPLPIDMDKAKEVVAELTKPVDIIDAGFSALACLQEYHSGDSDVEAWLKTLEDALHRGLMLELCVKDMDKWVKENEGMHIGEYVMFDDTVNKTESYKLYKEVSGV